MNLIKAPLVSKLSGLALVSRANASTRVSLRNWQIQDSRLIPQQFKLVSAHLMGGVLNCHRWQLPSWAATPVVSAGEMWVGVME